MRPKELHFHFVHKDDLVPISYGKGKRGRPRAKETS